MTIENCPSGVQFKYNESDSWTLLDADSYEVGYLSGQCFVGYQVNFMIVIREYLIDCDRDSKGDCVTDYFIRAYKDKTVSGSLTISGKFKISQFPFNVSSHQPTVQRLDGSIKTLADWKGSYSIAMTGVTSTGSSKGVNRTTDFYIPSQSQADYDTVSGKRYNARLFLNNSVVLDTCIPLSPEPSDCVRNCTFTAYKNNSQIYRQISGNCPIVSCINQACPENTCDVMCGDTICCYNSKGISVFNYPKP